MRGVTAIGVTAGRCWIQCVYVYSRCEFVSLMLNHHVWSWWGSGACQLHVTLTAVCKMIRVTLLMHSRRRITWTVPDGGLAKSDTCCSCGDTIAAVYRVTCSSHRLTPPVVYNGTERWIVGLYVECLSLVCFANLSSPLSHNECFRQSPVQRAPC